jgi:hypothetical protein
MTTCLACGTELQGHAKFCHECGAAVTSTLAALWVTPIGELLLPAQLTCSKSLNAVDVYKHAVTSAVDGEAGFGSSGQHDPAQRAEGLVVVEGRPGGEAHVAVRAFSDAIAANPDSVMGRSVETKRPCGIRTENWSSRLRYSTSRTPVSIVFALGSTIEMGGDVARIGDRAVVLGAGMAGGLLARLRGPQVFPCSSPI